MAEQDPKALVVSLQASTVQEFQRQLLEQLYNLRQTFFDDLSKQFSSEEAKDLADQNRRLEYRITHLTAALRSLM